MSKIKFNRYNIFLIVGSFLLILFFLLTYFNSFSEYVTKESSRIDGDTLYINDLASDYYYYLGMNYVGDLNSNTVNYQESDLKMVTINYYGYAEGDEKLSGYISLNTNERQNKIVYYKYFPIKNGNITFDLIDNPFSDRPRNKGFAGWTSDVGTISTNSNTNVQSITVPSSVDTINIYAKWQKANVIYLNGDNGDDSLNGKRPDNAVGSWSKAFQLLEQNATTLKNRELNIIVLTGNISNSFNYSNSLTHTINSTTINYTDHTTFGEEEVLLVFKDGNDRYALYDNWTNPAYALLSNSTEPNETAFWTIREVEGGYVIQNNSTERYLGYVQYYNDQVALLITNDKYVWKYDTNNRRFFTEFEVTRNKYTYTNNTDFVNGNNYLITKGTNPTNALDGYNYAISNLELGNYVFNNTAEWRITNVSGDTYRIYNVATGRYLNYVTDNDNVELSLSTARNWTYDSTNHTFSVDIHKREFSGYSYTTSNIGEGTSYIGFLNGNTARLIGYQNGLVSTTANSESAPNEETNSWEIIDYYGGYRIYNANSRRYLRRQNRNLNTTTSTYNATTWTYDTTNHYLYNGSYYLYLNGNTWGVTTSANNATEVYAISVVENYDEYDVAYYLSYDNGWKLEENSSNASLTFTSYTSAVETGDIPFYLRFDGNNFSLGEETNGSVMTYVTYSIDRNMSNERLGSTDNNYYYSTGTFITATITSLYNQIDYRNSATWDLSYAAGGYAQVMARDDLQLEYLKIDASGYQAINDSTTTSNLRTSYASLVGNSHNVRIGRGMSPNSWDDTTSTIFSYIQGGGDNSVGSTNSNNNAYRLVIESGRYSGLMASHINNNYSNTNYYNYYGTVYLTMGCDYDRAIKNDDLLDVFYRMGSKNYYGVNGKNDYHDLAYLMTIKSGTIGMYYFNNYSDASRAYSGIYVGGLTVNASSQNDDISSRILIVEGGSIANINGGLRITDTSGDNGVTTRTYIKGGTIQNIVGGAGVSTTYGDRYISVTGGNIAYSVSGGSNGVAATDESQQSGRLGGNSYVHVGGEAHIGTNGNGTLYDVTYGSVLGAGNGNQNYRTSGRVNTSNVYISGKAVIEGNVYGGGNFGPVLEDSNITIDGGTINGNVYGGANKNGVGTVAINESAVYTVTYDDDKTPTNGETYLINKINGTNRNLLSENNSQGTYNVVVAEGNQPSSYSRWVLNSVNGGYTLRNLNYNYYLGYTTNRTPSLTINNETTNSIWNYDNTNKTFYRDITYVTSTTVNYNFTTNITSGTEYVITNTNNAGSAYSIDGDTERMSLSSSTEPNENAWIFTSSNGGYTIRNKATGEYLSLGNGWSASLTTSYSPTVWTWNAANRRLSAVYEGWFGDTTYYLRYNNGWTISTNQYSVYLATYNINNTTATDRYYLVFENNNWRISTTASSISLSTFTSSATVGYVASNKANGDVNITMNDGKILGAVYGGACEEGNIAGTVTININGGDIGSDSENHGGVFGGGYGEDTFVATGVNLNISDNKNVNIDGTVYGGSALGTIIGNITVASIDNSENGAVTVNGDFYCGSMGDSTINTTGAIQGNCTLSLDGGTYKGSVFGGNNANGSPSGTIVVTTGGNNITKINTVYGGGNHADSTATSVTVNIEDKSDITNCYGGGNLAKVDVTNVNLHNGNVTNIYGGSNQSGDITTTNITTTGGNATNIFGGNNLGGTTATSNIKVNGGTIGNIYGGGNEAVTDLSNIDLVSGTVTNTFGGGNKAGITTSTNITLEGSTCTKIYGGSNESGDVPISYITATSGTADIIYGGNNIGGITTTTNVDISNITVNNVYGGGCSANTGTDNVTINSGTIGNVYGGGESASVINDTNVSVLGGTIENVYGGSNKSGTVPVSHVNITNGTINTIYGGNNAGGTTETTNVLVTTGTITNIYGGGSKADSITTNVTLNNSTNTISNIFGGGKEASATTTNVTLNNGRATNVFGGSNTSGTIKTSNVIVNDGTYTSVYGSNNDGGKTETTNVTINSGNVTDVFGGGNNAPTDDTNLIITGATILNNAYGGGNNAAVNNNTNVTISSKGHINNNLFGGGNNGAVNGNTTVSLNNGIVDKSAYAGGNNASVGGNTNITLNSNSNVKENLFGGGNNGTVLGNTNVSVIDSSVNGSAYAGGNGETAIVSSNTNISIQGNSSITRHVFGGGNAAATGNSASNNSLGVVNITGGIINGNVYGGANTSVLYGKTTVNIGNEAVIKDTGITTYKKGNIFIGGTVFGGGEANESGSDTYDFDFISVTTGITINIDGKDYNTFTIAGSIFGSGNASSTTGYSNIYLSNYGSSDDIKNNISLQRADLAVLDNVFIALSGATDRTNEYSQVLFSISRITELDLKNNSEIYLENGANLLNRLKSLDNEGNKASVVIDENTHEVTADVINKVFMEEDKVLNIAVNQNVTDYGEVDGMAFFGMFNRDRNGKIVTAMYNTDYATGDTPATGELYYFTSGSYVLGRHETNHNIKIDGFYTNYEDENNPGKILVDYIKPSPEDAEHYIWSIGVSVQSYDIELVASKYSTLGTNEFSFVNNAKGNTTFSILGFSYNDLDSNVNLLEPDFIPRIANTGEAADNTFGLAIKPGTGWLTVGETYFVTDNANLFTGTKSYKTENSNITPSFIFYLYHSKNLQTAGTVGSVIISVEAVTPINDLQNQIERFNFNITITRALFDSNDYEGAMTPGRQYEMFTSSRMDITSKSSLSAYYSLFVEQQNGQPIYRSGYHRALVSNVILPVNTKITMIDFASSSKPEYYYYIVNQADNDILSANYALNNEVEYPLSKFIRMGSSNENNRYDDEIANGIYFDSSHNLAIEEFIFIVDFANTEIDSNMLNNSLLIEMLDEDNNILHSVLGIERDNMTYNLYANQQSVVDVEATVSKNVLYVGEVQDLKVITNFNQNSEESQNRIIDTTYYNQKLGLKVSVFDEHGRQLNGVDLLGVSLTLDGITNYARSDGTYRFKIADRVANVYSNIKINTTNSSLTSGNYTIKVESFYSADGIYFGSVPADTAEVTFRIMDRKYGLKATIDDNEIIVTGASGKNVNGNNNLNFTIDYSGGLITPTLKVVLYRRNYDEVYDTKYNDVNLLDYVTDELESTIDENIYDLIDEVSSTNTYTFHLKDKLRTGTYKIEFRLYDGDSFVGEVFKYIIIK